MTDEIQNTATENMEIPHKINSVSDLSKILQTLGEPEKGYTRFFRGHADKDWQMLPSIYRAQHLIENEDKIIKDALTYCPDDFVPSDTLFEKLVKLQHYGYSTRLLDLTTNALVALYFAACNEQHHDKDGELIILDIPNEQIKYDDSNAVVVLSAVSIRPIPFEISFYRETAEKFSKLKIMEYIRNNREDHELIKDCFEGDSSINNKVKSLGQSLGFSNYQDFCDSVEKVKEIIGNNAYLEMFNKQKDIDSLIDDIHTDKPCFRPLIHPDDLERVLCVRAKLNNARISRQQGCFLLFGINGSKKEAAAIPDTWQRFALNKQKILVIANTLNFSYKS